MSRPWRAVPVGVEGRDELIFPPTQKPPLQMSSACGASLQPSLDSWCHQHGFLLWDTGRRPQPELVTAETLPGRARLEGAGGQGERVGRCRRNQFAWAVEVATGKIGTDERGCSQ